jgi:acetyl-CoA synthetase
MHHGRQGHRGSLGRKEKLFAAQEVQEIGQRQERERFQYRAQESSSNLGQSRQRLHWFKPWKKVLEWSSPWAKWFVGGKINASDNYLDRHVKSEGKNKTAI